MLDLRAFNQLENQIMSGMPFIGDEMNKSIDYRMETCSKCDGSCSGTCDDTCKGYCEGCGDNG